MRGNHDNPNIWINNTFKYSNIKLIQDYETKIFNNKKYLFVGGAISVDRKQRKEGIDYWNNEKFILDEDKLNTFSDIDIVITHTCPEYAPPCDYDNSFC